MAEVMTWGIGRVVSPIPSFINFACGYFSMCSASRIEIFSPTTEKQEHVRRKTKSQKKRTRLDRSPPMRADLGKKITIFQVLHVDISGDFCAMTCDWSRKYGLDTRNYLKTSIPLLHSNDPSYNILDRVHKTKSNTKWTDLRTCVSRILVRREIYIYEMWTRLTISRLSRLWRRIIPPLAQVKEQKYSLWLCEWTLLNFFLQVEF